MQLKAGMLLAAIAIAVPAEASSSVAASTLVPLTLLSLNSGVSGFFGLFRRRTRVTPAPANIPREVEEMVDRNAPPAFPRPGGFFSNPFRFGGGFFPSMPQPQFPIQQFQGQGFPGMSFQQQMAQQMTQQQIPQHLQNQVFQQFQQDELPRDEEFEFNRPGRADESTLSLNPDEAESFFTLLSETDESQCISRMVCEMGADPASSGEFGQTVTDIISNLRDFPAGSKVSYYNEIMQTGIQRGMSACSSRFSACDDESLQLVKNAQMSENQN